MKTIDAEKLDDALTKRISFWMTTDKAQHDVAQQAMIALVDVRQCVREAAGIDKPLNDENDLLKKTGLNTIA